VTHTSDFIPRLSQSHLPPWLVHSHLLLPDFFPPCSAESMLSLTSLHLVPLPLDGDVFLIDFSPDRRTLPGSSLPPRYTTAVNPSPGPQNPQVLPRDLTGSSFLHPRFSTSGDFEVLSSGHSPPGALVLPPIVSLLK